MTIHYQRIFTDFLSSPPPPHTHFHVARTPSNPQPTQYPILSQIYAYVVCKPVSLRASTRRRIPSLSEVRSRAAALYFFFVVLWASRYLRHHNPDPSAPNGVRPAAVQTFVKSTAGYCVITYLVRRRRGLERVAVVFFLLDLILRLRNKSWWCDLVCE